MQPVAVAAAVAFVATIVALPHVARGEGFFMPWLCLENFPDCRKSSGEVQAQVLQLTQNADLFPFVSLSFFGIQPDGSIDVTGTNCPKCIARQLQAAGIKACGMITSGTRQHIVNFLANQNAMGQVASEINAYNLDCVNFDLENFDTGVRKELGEFMGNMKTYLSKHTVSASRPNGAILSVDVVAGPEHGAYWRTLYTDVSTALAQASGAPATMPVEMYARHQSNFEIELSRARQTIAADQLVVGLDSHTNSGGLSDSEVQRRFASLEQYNICRAALWQTPVPTAWLGYIRSMANRCNFATAAQRLGNLSAV